MKTSIVALFRISVHCWIGLAACTTAAHGAMAVPDEAPRDNISVHHVRLVGTAFEKFNEDVFGRTAEMCTALGRTPEPIPPGESILELVHDDYYAIGGVTRHITRKMYSLHPQTCKLQRSERHEVTMVTAQGSCDIKPDRKRAVGYCGVKSLLAAKAMATVPYPSVRPTGKMSTIAGTKCEIWEGVFWGQHSRECVARSDNAVGMSHDGRIRRYGLVLKQEIWSSNHPDQKEIALEAVSVQTNIKVDLTVLAPHTAGGYQVFESAQAK